MYTITKNWLKFLSDSGGGLVSCQCFLGYTGNGYGINGCQTTSLVRSVCQHNYCKHGGTCIPQSGPDQSFICHCPQGFGGKFI